MRSCALAQRSPAGPFQYSICCALPPFMGHQAERALSRLAGNSDLARIRPQQLIAPELLQHVGIAPTHQRDAALKPFARVLERDQLLLLAGKLGPGRSKRHEPALPPNCEVAEIGH